MGWPVWWVWCGRTILNNRNWGPTEEPSAVIAEDPAICWANVVPIWWCVVEVETGTDKCEEDEMDNEVVIRPQIANPLAGSA